MSKIKRQFIKGCLYFLASAALTFFIVRLLLALLHFDYATSVIPGWHTTILPLGAYINSITFFLLIASGIINGIFFLIKYFLETVVARLVENSKQRP